MIVPPPLRPGDVVRVIAPAGPFDPEQLERGLGVLRGRLGLVPRLRPDVVARRGYLAGDDARRLEEWREAAADPDARALWCARGGYGTMRILPGVDPRPLLASPRWLVGFSDITALHAVLNEAGLATIHGPMVAFLPRLEPEALSHLEALLFGRAAREPSGSGAAPPPGAGCSGPATLRPGRARGPLRGGSLAILAHLCGTPWQPRLGGAILFLEDVGESPYKLDRYLTQLRLAGALDGVAGVCVGQLTDCERPGDPAGAETVREIVGALGVPAIEGVAAGHERMNLALRLGAPATLVAPGPGEAGPPRIVFEEAA